MILDTSNVAMNPAVVRSSQYHQRDENTCADTAPRRRARICAWVEDIPLRTYPQRHSTAGQSVGAAKRHVHRRAVRRGVGLGRPATGQHRGLRQPAGPDRPGGRCRVLIIAVPAAWLCRVRLCGGGAGAAP
jgi:hypothetical protein